MRGEPDPVVVVSYDPGWVELFGRLAARLRAALGATAIRIDHIGSTSVPGLDAKPIIDVQISVRSFEPFDAILRPLEECGFVWRSDNPELTKRYFRERPGDRRTHLHVRKAGSFDEQFALLFRDFLRHDSGRAVQYAALKHRLATTFETNRAGYEEAKGPFIWETIRLANQWAQQIGWEPGPSDG